MCSSDLPEMEDAAEQMPMPLTVSQPSDTSGCATLISDTSSERLLGTSWLGSGDCHRNARFSTPRLLAAARHEQGWRLAGRLLRAALLATPRPSREVDRKSVV